MKYEKICIPNDPLKERYIQGAELVGKYGFPKLDPVHAYLEDLRPVAFPMAKSEKKPRECVAHFFVMDDTFERVWANLAQHLDYLQYFTYVCSPDFSVYSNMPLALQLYNVYRNRALAYCMAQNGISIIPTVGWSDESSYDFCFDGLPKNSTLAVSTNGCFTKSGITNYQMGFTEMCKRLEPREVLVIGKQIEVNCGVKITYMDSFGQQMTKRLKGGA